MVVFGHHSSADRCLWRVYWAYIQDRVEAAAVASAHDR